MAFHTADYQRGYDAGYKQALLDALANKGASNSADQMTGLPRRMREARRKLSENGL